MGGILACGGLKSMRDHATIVSFFFTVEGKIGKMLPGDGRTVRRGDGNELER